MELRCFLLESGVLIGVPVQNILSMLTVIYTTQNKFCNSYKHVFVFILYWRKNGN